MQRRWFSRRALLLHLEVAIVAPGCVAAGWWQATRALAGNELSWAYSVEWPAFALLAIVGWWHLVHEDPEVYRVRRQGPLGGEDEVTVADTVAQVMTFEEGEEVAVVAPMARMATRLALLIGVEFALGIVALAVVPIRRPSSWLPAEGIAIYLGHSILGLALAVGAVVFFARVRGASKESSSARSISPNAGASALLGPVAPRPHRRPQPRDRRAERAHRGGDATLSCDPGPHRHHSRDLHHRR